MRRRIADNGLSSSRMTLFRLMRSILRRWRRGFTADSGDWGGDGLSTRCGLQNPPGARTFVGISGDKMFASDTSLDFGRLSGMSHH